MTQKNNNNLNLSSIIKLGTTDRTKVQTVIKLKQEKQHKMDPTMIPTQSPVVQNVVRIEAARVKDAVMKETTTIVPTTITIDQGRMTEVLTIETTNEVDTTREPNIPTFMGK
jgi:hypothetical protein